MEEGLQNVVQTGKYNNTLSLEDVNGVALVQKLHLSLCWFV